MLYYLLRVIEKSEDSHHQGPAWNKSMLSEILTVFPQIFGPLASVPQASRDPGDLSSRLTHVTWGREPNLESVSYKLLW